MILNSEIYMVRYLFLFITLFVSSTCFSQNEDEMLLANTGIQIESTDAINDMYNFKFDKAEAYFLHLKDQYPNHPMPYFLMALSNFWKMVPYIDTEDFRNTYEKEFLMYIDSGVFFYKLLMNSTSELYKILKGMFFEHTKIERELKNFESHYL